MVSALLIPVIAQVSSNNFRSSLVILSRYPSVLGLSLTGRPLLLIKHHSSFWLSINSKIKRERSGFPFSRCLLPDSRRSLLYLSLIIDAAFFANKKKREPHRFPSLKILKFTILFRKMDNILYVR